jgi:hypothetical protein
MCTCWRGKIKFHRCRVWSTTGICIGTQFFPLLYQRHARWYKINSETLCNAFEKSIIKQ